MPIPEITTKELIAAARIENQARRGDKLTEDQERQRAALRTRLKQASGVDVLDALCDNGLTSVAGVSV